MANIKWTAEKVATLRELLSAGGSIQKCADHFGRSRAAIYLVVRTRLPDITPDKYGQGLRNAIRKSRRDHLAQLAESRPEKKDLATAQKIAFQNKASNVKKTPQWEFTIKMDDLTWPTHCPVLGIELDWFAPRKAENSPSFDRIDTNKGYVPGNVAIMSWRANRIKNDGTVDEHLRIASWLQSSL